MLEKNKSSHCKNKRTVLKNQENMKIRTYKIKMPLNTKYKYDIENIYNKFHTLLVSLS